MKPPNTSPGFSAFVEREPMAEIEIEWRGNTAYATATKGRRFENGEHVQKLEATEGSDVLAVIARLATEACDCAQCQKPVITPEKVRELMRAHRCSAIVLAERLGLTVKATVDYRRYGVKSAKEAVKFIAAIKF
jgi:hypothetical protein